MHYFLRHYGLNAKIHHSSIRLPVLGRITWRNCQVSHSWLGIIESFDMYSCVYARKHHSRICLENTNFWWTRGKWWTIYASSYVKIVGAIGKSSHEHGREQKFRQMWYVLSREHPLCLSKKLTDGSQRIVRRPHTNYMNIVFANRMFTSVLRLVRAVER